LDKAKISRLLTLSLISIICFAFKYFFIFHFDISFKFFRFGLITSVIAYLTLIYDTGNSFKSHGAYNRLFLYFGIPIVYFFLYFKLVIYRCYKKYGKLIPIVVAVFLVFLIFKINTNYYCSCDYWDKGFKNSKIDNDVSCKLEKPRVCYEIIFDNVFDAIFYSKDDCKNRRNDDPEIVKEYTKLKSITKVAYPRVEKWEHTHTCNYYYYRDSVMKQVFNLDDPNKPEKLKKLNEVYVDFTVAENPQVNIELKKDEELIKNRDRIFQDNIKKEKVIFKNVLFFFIDSMSRNHFKRKLPRVYE